MESQELYRVLTIQNSCDGAFRHTNYFLVEKEAREYVEKVEKSGGEVLSFNKYVLAEPLQ